MRAQRQSQGKQYYLNAEIFFKTIRETSDVEDEWVKARRNVSEEGEVM